MSEQWRKIPGARDSASRTPFVIVARAVVVSALIVSALIVVKPAVMVDIESLLITVLVYCFL